MSKSKPKAGMKLHKFIATGGKPKDFTTPNDMLNSMMMPGGQGPGQGGGQGAGVGAPAVVAPQQTLQ